MTERDIFIAALQQPGPAERAAYLDGACGGDHALRGLVEELLREQEQLGSFLERPAEDRGTGPFTPVSGEKILTTSAERPGTVIGPYKLLQPIGEGGMGTVFMAEQTQPVQRKVALKVIKAGMDSRQVIARFEAERQALAMMDHVNIARVLDAGATEAGLPYFVMELVHGVPITKYCDDNHLTPRERLELFVPVCQAIQHAHQKGIIHRDVKPSNVMITLYDGKPVPKVIDFGIAKATEQKLTERTLFTQYGAMVGTLEYMSPEQAEMSALGIDTRSDVYSLGVLLYELLTGGTPLGHKRVQEADYAEILRIIREEEPPRPSTRLSDSGEALASISANRHTEPAKLAKLVRGDLDWIVMKSLEKDRNRRYESAGAFAADVQRCLADKPVLACPPSAAYRFRKFARRNKARLTLAVVLGLALVVVLCAVAASIGWAARDRAARRSEGERRAEVALKEAGRLLEEEKWPGALSLVELAEGVLDNSGGGADLVNKARGLRQELETAQSLEEARLKVVMDEDFDLRAGDVAYSEAFLKYRLDVDRLDSQEAAGRVRTSPIRRQLIAALDQWAFIGKIVNADGWQRRLAVARAADPDPWRNRLRDALEGNDARALVDAVQSASPKSWSAATLALLARLANHTAFAEEEAVLAYQETVRLHPDFAGGKQDLKDALWRLAAFPDPQPRNPARTVELAEKSVELMPEDGTIYLALGMAQYRAGNWPAALASMEKARSLRDGGDANDWLGLAMVHHRLGDEATAGQWYEKATQWIGQHGSPTGLLRLRAEAAEALGRTRVLRSFKGHTEAIHGVALSADGSRAITCSFDGSLRCWNLDSAKEEGCLKGHAGRVLCVALTPDGSRALSGGDDRPVRLWDVDKGEEIRQFLGHTQLVECVALSPDGKLAASGGQDKSVRLWEVDAGNERRCWTGHTAGVRCVSFSPDGKQVVSGSWDNTVRLWSVETGEELRQFQGHGGGVICVAFCPDGGHILSGSEDQTLRLWDAKTGEEVRRFEGHTGGVICLALSADGRRAVSGGDFTARVWDVETGKELYRFDGHAGGVWAAVFTPDGNRVLSGCADETGLHGTVLLWELPPELRNAPVKK
jgi:serine/threonine protein kinase/tetratricopeptide (TPR) repeat protein